ncbi:SET domain-containing protein 5 [Golovinomyces cichoracearum]|uniref:SET domain-containing protein 5 n=1 Tax=Golovinomyces cichoracearum TaxID=62708 RepID=A0A420H9Q9_9PEZI|nr:SET domain-containing protein 5 [Golovinomyces cichoracearum]
MFFNIASVKPECVVVESKPPHQRLSYADIVRGTFNQSATSVNSSNSPFHLGSPPYHIPITDFQSAIDHVLFNTEFFQVRKTLHKGYGAFASRNIDEGTIIMAEKPLMKAEVMTVYYEYEKLTKQQQNEFRSLAGWKILGPMPIAIFKTNRFEITRTIGGIFVRCSRFNHACHPYANCTYAYEKAEDSLVITSIKKIFKGDEITISYTNVPSTLPENYGFSCDCPNCRIDTSQESKED